LPVVEGLAGFAEGSDYSRAVEAIKSIVTVETLTIMQLIGFNFRRAIGEPLTTLVERLILNRVALPNQSVELRMLELRQQAAYFEALADPQARQLLLQGQATSAPAE
jgi:hypothetical protein